MPPTLLVATGIEQTLTLALRTEALVRNKLGWLSESLPGACALWGCERRAGGGGAGRRDRPRQLGA